MKIEGEWALNPEDLAAIFEKKGWIWHTEEGCKIPTAQDLDKKLYELVQQMLDRDEDVVAVQNGRLLIWKDNELPNSYDLFLNIGFIWDQDALGDGDEVPA